MFNKQNLKKFLKEAKINTYAGSGEMGEIKLRNGGKKFGYKKGNFYYQDTYFGFDPFIGEEIIFHQQKIIWGMNYYGQIMVKNILAKDIYKFLKRVLQKVSLINPYRGPDIYQNDNFKYVNKTEGDICKFKGQEKIYHENKLVYILYYHGGKIKNIK